MLRILGGYQNKNNRMGFISRLLENDLHSDRRLIDSANGTELGRVADVVNARASVQKDFNKFED